MTPPLMLVAFSIGCAGAGGSASTSDGGATSAADAVATSDAATSDVRTTDAGSALNDGYKNAKWASGVTVTYGDCTLRYRSNGIPNHARDTEYAVPNTGVIVPSASTAHAASDPTTTQSYDITINTCPTVGATTTKTSLGSIGYMISGASLFNPYEGDASTVALASNFYVTDSAGAKVYFVDSCNGHPTPMGQYHYHGLPSCVTSEVDVTNGPSHIIGIAIDGFPVYGNRDLSGQAITAKDLDECNGITSATPEFPGGVYHYVLLDAADDTSSIRCYRGTPATGATAARVLGAGRAGSETLASATTWAPCGADAPLSTRDDRFARWIGAIGDSFDEGWRFLGASL
jgi:hypothetical protein